MIVGGESDYPGPMKHEWAETIWKMCDPKRITNEGFVRILNIASSTLSEILRRGEKSVVSSHFAGETS